MAKKFKDLVLRAVAAIVCSCAVYVPVFAATATDNPLTGDTQGRYIGVVIAVMAVALIVIVIIAAISAKKKK